MTREAQDAAIAFLLQLDSATQREVIERYEDALQLELDTTSRRLRRIAVALHQTKRTLRRSPSLREYKALREKHPERGWPDPRSITRWLGVRSWNDALVRMRLEPVLDGDAIEGTIVPTYSIDEVVQAVRDCAEDLGRAPTITDYLAWQRRPDVRERPGRRPASTWVFHRIFGGFPQARVAAGLVEADSTAAHPSDLLLRSANYRVTREQILDDIRCVATRTQGHLTATIYDRERRLVYQETKAQGRPRALAGVGTIYRNFFSWTAALEEADLDRARREAAPGDRGGRRLSDEQVLRALSDASEAVEERMVTLLERLTTERYEAWREQESKRDPTRRSSLPSYGTIWRRFGGWKNALERMYEWRTGG